jgi:hypothetical protein
MNQLIAEQIETIRTRYPQAHAVEGRHGSHLIIVPGYRLPKGWSATICTVLFIAPAGFPSIMPKRFWVDIPDLRVTQSLSFPHCTNTLNPIPGFPQWKWLTWFAWRPQVWNYQDTLYTFLMVIRRRLEIVR